MLTLKSFYQKYEPIANDFQNFSTFFIFSRFDKFFRFFFKIFPINPQKKVESELDLPYNQLSTGLIVDCKDGSARENSEADAGLVVSCIDCRHDLRSLLRAEGTDGV